MLYGAAAHGVGGATVRDGRGGAFEAVDDLAARAATTEGDDVPRASEASAAPAKSTLEARRRKDVILAQPRRRRDCHASGLICGLRL